MKRDTINYTMVGIFVVTMAVLFFIVLYKITGRTGPTDEYYSEYANVTGVKYGTPVLYEGFQVGQVEEIKPLRSEGKTRYRVKITVEKEWPIPEDSIATMIASGLLSAITIDIEEGQSNRILKPGSLIKSREAANIFDAVNDVATELQDLSKGSIKPLINNLNREILALSNDLRSLTTESIKPAVEKIGRRLDDEVISDLVNLIKKLNESADRLLIVLDDNNQQNLDDFLSNMNSASSTLNEVIFRIEDTRAAMNQVLLNVDGVVSDNKEHIKGSMADLEKSLTAISDNIDTILYHMDGSSRNMHELSRQLRENPSLIIKSSPQNEEEQ